MTGAVNKLGSISFALQANVGNVLKLKKSLFICGLGVKLGKGSQSLSFIRMLNEPRESREYS